MPGQATESLAACEDARGGGPGAEADYSKLLQSAIAEVVKKPNYNGISATFWRSLKGVGGADLSEVLGTPFCGKGEPNQVIRVGHASPPALFADVDVFGGE